MSVKPDIITCHVLCCFGSSCKKHGAEDVFDTLKHELQTQDAHKRVHITKTHCNHLCKHSPVVMIYPDGVWYQGMTPKSTEKVVRKHILKGKILKKHLLTILQEKGRE